MNKTAPNGFCPKVFTVAVWDNIDWDEETVSGSGTAHHTNGILVQPFVSEFDQQACFLSLKKSQRKIHVEPTPIHPYQLTSREGPKVVSSRWSCTFQAVFFFIYKARASQYHFLKGHSHKK